jgi:hypothetical protein
VLTAWAEANPGFVGEEPTALGVVDEDRLYGVARDFWQADPALLVERDAAERTVGIQRGAAAGVEFDLIDLGRIDPNLCDARLAGWRMRAQPAPVVIRVAPALGDAAVGLVRQILDTVGPNLTQVTLTLPGSVLGGAPGAVVAPSLLVRWAGDELVQVPGAVAAIADLAAYTEVEARQGAVLSASSAAWLSAATLGELVRRLGVVAVEIGGADLVATLAEARWSGLLPPTAEVSWWVVHHHLTRTGRADRATLGAHAAIALAALRRLVGPEPTRPAAARAEKPSRRSVRIKA